MTIKAVIFDFGGVLYKTPDYRWLLRLMQPFRRQMDELLWGLYLSPTELPYVKAVLSGQIPEEKVWEAFSRRTRLNHRWVQRMRSGSYSRRRLNHPMIDLLQSFRPRYKTAILTNAASEFRSTFCQAFSMEDWADEVIISAETGFAKPDADIYLNALQAMRVRPEESIFVDDMEENVAGARSIGMRAFQFQSNQQVTRQIEHLLRE